MKIQNIFPSRFYSKEEHYHVEEMYIRRLIARINALDTRSKYKHAAHLKYNRLKNKKNSTEAEKDFIKIYKKIFDP